MEQRSDSADRDDLREEYDFSGGARGTYAKRYAEGGNIVVLGILKLISQSERSLALDDVKPHSDLMSELRSRLKTN
ncbi:MAG: hypothetical protein OXQ31_11650 [Spirochaetaceae bacterium]|nr:hypothetical protein [Spirochaetaceae bacterium]